MDDAVSRDSVTSSTSEEFVVVNGEPKLKVAADVNDISEEIASATATDFKMSDSRDNLEEHCDHVIPGSQSVNILSSESILENYPDTPSEESKPMPGSDRVRSASLPATPNGDCTIFNGVTYLGSAMVNAPRSEGEIYRNMAVLNQHSQSAIPVALSVPATSEGIVNRSGELVRLLEPTSNTEITNFRIHRILFCARGPSDTDERQCFAFTCSHGDTAENTIFQCHVFRCDIPEAVPKILYCFANTFRRIPKRQKSNEASFTSSEHTFTFSVSLEFREDDGKGGYSVCPKDKDVFKFRVNTEKRLQISVQQSGPHDLRIERCFGLLISPGRNVQHSDMQLIELVSMGYAPDTKLYNVAGQWDPSEKCFAILNTETEKDTRVFLTVAVDLVLFGIQEPVRFILETRAKIYPVSERFWYLSRNKGFTEQFSVRLKQVEGNGDGKCYEVVKVESQTEVERRTHNMTLNLSGTNRAPPESIKTPQEEEDSDIDEPLLSGSGIVSKEVTDENLLEAWAEVLARWRKNLSSRPRQVTQLVRKTIPEALRGEVWLLLAGCHDNQDLLEAYRTLIIKDSPSDAVIQRDINRTFPAHDFFKDAGGQGQDSLYRISKAYSVYDEEIGYVQGLSFLAAALLLHMPEEQAFCVLVKIMYDYQLRELFKQGFQVLHLKFYQLERLMQDHLPDLYDHFAEMGLEIHMFASQWFLTLFTAKFPLHLVFGILDLFLSEGHLIIFCVALALLKSSRKDLLAHDFEGVLKYFRVHLPKRFRGEEPAKELMRSTVNMKVSSRKLKKYEKEYQTIQEQSLAQEDPVERYERENKRLLEANMRLEQENDDLAHELVDSKLNLNNQIDTLTDKCLELDRDLKQTSHLLKETEDEKKRLDAESKSLKEMCRRELERAESESKRNTAIIADYKQICTQLSERLEKQQTTFKEELVAIKAQVKSCNQCCALFDGDNLRMVDNSRETQEDPDVTLLQKHIRELELELAQTKLALVESECKTQDLTHQLNAAVTEITANKNTWFQKTLSSIRDVASTKKDPKD
ncbi:rab GTPase-activating protein 1-like isoform X1 [Biomphalaria glabrata]|uniref:Rab GTPase-activating protein 1-like isoform X1 n=2 Tax=Biomphalaria glabrata TaxID=6526 RepID=A0A9W3B8K2_BIOGL|nr:rab GTPase-activating protein 1-like isoform X1 [Biomphalaria glabrata]XP_055895790.1 rab GTPase-activating protein 1-like isoform X1 [Biomphalaria glabrata]XP_055895791.1 rab GTPase-activating protein 1-like isoform X1 [Biomphalaria glabrata]